MISAELPNFVGRPRNYLDADQELIADIWDEKVGSGWQRTSYGALKEFLEEDPTISIQDTVNTILYQLSEFAGIRDVLEAQKSKICYEVETRPEHILYEHAAAASKRSIVQSAWEERSGDRSAWS